MKRKNKKFFKLDNLRELEFGKGDCFIYGKFYFKNGMIFRLGYAVNSNGTYYQIYSQSILKLQLPYLFYIWAILLSYVYPEFGDRIVKKFSLKHRDDIEYNCTHSYAQKGIPCAFAHKKRGNNQEIELFCIKRAIIRKFYKHEKSLSIDVLAHSFPKKGYAYVTVLFEPSCKAS